MFFKKPPKIKVKFTVKRVGRRTQRAMVADPVITRSKDGYSFCVKTLFKKSLELRPGDILEYELFVK